MVERCLVLLICDGEGMMHASMVVEHGVNRRRVALY
jgi:hypothetical protein